MNRPSIMAPQHSFARVPSVGVPRNAFNRSHGYQTTFDAGYLVPILVDEVLPGDTFKCVMQGFARLLSPMKHPVMSNMYMDTFFFFVPNRLVWEHWVNFMGEKVNPDDTTEYTVPKVTGPGGGYSEMTLMSYMGVPILVPDLPVNALHPRAYNKIYNTWFRDQNIIDSIPENMDDGPDNAADYVLRRRGKRHDYFTSCLPWPQKGPDVLLPLGGFAPIERLGSGNLILGQGAEGSFEFRLNNDPATIETSSGASPSPADIVGTVTGSGEQVGARLVLDNDAVNSVAARLQANLASSSAPTINAFREAMQLQVFGEVDARGGTRYTEKIRAHFDVVSPDARLQRPEYLGGGSSRLSTHVVPQTSKTDGSAQGNLAAFGTVSVDGHGFTKSFTEHGVIIGLVNVRADLTYQYGLRRMWSRDTQYDFAWPVLARLGEQAVLNREIYAQGDSAIDPETSEPYDDGVFGYQERYGDYRYFPSLVTGLLVSDATGSLDTWTLVEELESLPTLSPSFINDNPPIDRIIAVPDEPHFILDVFFNYHCVRPLPLFGVPAGLERF